MDFDQIIYRISRRIIGTALVLLVGWTAISRAAVLTEETFDTNAAGWSDRDGNMSFSHSSGYIQATFANPEFPLTDAFRVTSGDFVGDYLAAGAQSINFSFQSLNVAPSDISFRLFGANHFFFIPLSPTAGTYNPTIPLTHSTSWFGSGGAFEFNQALASVDEIQIQFTTSGSGTQSFRLNSFELSGDQSDPPPGPGSGLGAIPEPGSSLFLVGALLLFALRGRAQQKPVAVRYAANQF